MKNIDLTPLKDNNIQYNQIVSAIENKYKCDWDDTVHDSYSKYVTQLREYSQKVGTICHKAETLEKEIECLKINELKTNAKRLCQEADSL